MVFLDHLRAVCFGSGCDHFEFELRQPVAPASKLEPREDDIGNAAIRRDVADAFAWLLWSDPVVEFRRRDRRRSIRHESQTRTCARISVQVAAIGGEDGGSSSGRASQMRIPLHHTPADLSISPSPMAMATIRVVAV